MQTQVMKKISNHSNNGWTLGKCAWSTLILDKKIAILPVMGMSVMFLVLSPVIFFASLRTVVWNGLTASGTQNSLSLGWWAIPFFLAVYLVLSTINNFFAVAVCHAALQRFNGNTPTIKGSIGTAWQRLGSIVRFSFFAGTVGYAFKYLHEHVPFGGKFVAFAADIAWSIATYLALPVIASEKKNVAPMYAIRKSAKLIKKTWGESLTADLSIIQYGIAALLGLFVSAMVLLIGVVLVDSLVQIGSFTLVAGIGLLAYLAVGVFAVVIIMTGLSAVVKAAVYHYAVTGESPETFNKELLRAAMTPKKARKVFA